MPPLSLIDPGCTALDRSLCLHQLQLLTCLSVQWTVFPPSVVTPFSCLRQLQQLDLIGPAEKQVLDPVENPTCWQVG